jgi:hypothetical protein
MQAKKLSFPSTDLLIPLLIMLPVAWALWPSGLPNTADGPVHFIRAAEMVHAWREGLLIPRWSANLGYGYGLPLFIYAPPLPYFLTAILHILSLSLEAAFKGMLLLGLALSSFGAYYLARNTLGIWAGAVSAAAYTYAPIRLRELFIQGNAGQFMAWAFLPWACWGLVRLYQTGHKRYALVMALALTGTILSHNAVALLLAWLLSALTLTLLLTGKNIALTAWAVIGGLLGLSLSAWFWLPALFEGEYIQLHHIVASDFSTRFVPLAELVALSPPLDSGAINPYYPLTLGAGQIGLAFIGSLGLLVALIARLSRSKIEEPARPRAAPFGTWACLTPQKLVSRPENARLNKLTLTVGLFFVGFSLFGAFMALAWSEPLWRVLPFVDLFEFPARWHGLTMVGLAWLGGLAIHMSGSINSAFQRLAGAGSLLLLLGTALVNLYPQNLPLNFFQAAPADVVRFEVETGSVGTTSLGEFNPIWVTDTFDTSTLVADYLAGRPVNRINHRTLPPEATSTTELSTIQAHRFKLKLPTPATVTLNLLYFPGWRATLDGTPLAISPHPGSGLIDLTVPAGEHTLELTFGPTPLRRLAEMISLLTWLGLVGLLVFQLISPKRPDHSDADCGPLRAKKLGDPKRPGHSPPTPPEGGTLITPGTAGVQGQDLFIIALVIGLILGVRQVFPGWFRIASPPDQALPATTPLRADFEDQIRLLGVDLPPTVVVPNDTLTVVAYWRALQDLNVNYAVFLHLDTPDGQTIATADESYPEEIPTSHWHPNLYLRNPLELTIPAEAPPIRYSLRLGLYDNQSGRPLTLTGNDPGQTSLAIGEVWVAAPAPAKPAPGPQAQFGESITLRGVRYDETAQTVTLYWQTDAPIPQDYSIFLHLLDANGELIGQADGTPYQNQYPTTAWRPGQLIEDVRSIPSTATDASQISQFAIGVYDPLTGVRLEAIDEASHALPNNALIIKIDHLR